MSEEKYKPKFMEWGIITKENFISTKYVPVKRWDPLSSVSIKEAKFGLKEHVRYYGHYSYISVIRGQRPMTSFDAVKKIDYQKCTESDLAEVQDPFTAETEGKAVYDKQGNLVGDGYTVIITEDEKKVDPPFHETPHRIEKLSGSCKALTIINRYPSMARVIDPDIRMTVEKELPRHAKLAFGINLLTISRNFYPSLCFRLIPEKILTGIFTSMKAGIMSAIEDSIERDYYDIPVTPFFNIGTQVGGSQPRIHAQVYIDLNGDGHGARLENFLQAFKEMGDNCRLCDTTHGDKMRTVLSTKLWTFFATASPIRNFHLRFHPNEHIRRITQLNENQIADLAKCLKIIFKALDDLKVDANRNIIFNCCPYGYDANFHMFGDIIPHEIIGGAEMADDMRVARRLPEEIAEELRKAIASQ